MFFFFIFLFYFIPIHEALVLVKLHIKAKHNGKSQRENEAPRASSHHIKTHKLIKKFEKEDFPFPNPEMKFHEISISKPSVASSEMFSRDFREICLRKHKKRKEKTELWTLSRAWIRNLPDETFGDQRLSSVLKGEEYKIQPHLWLCLLRNRSAHSRLLRRH